MFLGARKTCSEELVLDLGPKTNHNQDYFNLLRLS